MGLKQGFIFNKHDILKWEKGDVKMFKPKNINHVAFAVWSIEKALPFFMDVLGAKIVSEPFIPSDRQHRVILLSIGGMDIEILEPTDEDGFLARFLKKRGEGFHHIGIDVSELEEGARVLKSRGFVLIRERLDNPGLKFVMTHPKSTYGIEFHFHEGRQSLADFQTV